VNFVGSWETLLGKLFARRFVSEWLNDADHSYADIRRYAKSDMYHHFFVEESVLEKGEFLLADKKTAMPKGYLNQPEAWHEQLFSSEVHAVLRESIRQTLVRTCVGEPGRVACAACPLYGDSSSPDCSYTLGDMYAVYAEVAEGIAIIKRDEICPYLLNHATTTAVVEYCARSNVRYVITYNFDTVVEEMLFEAIERGAINRSDTAIHEIHLWTFGRPKDSRRVASGGTVEVYYHQGGCPDDLSALSRSGTIHFFHVHGVSASEMFEGVASQLVFSEHSYQAYQDACFNWSSRVLQSVLTRYPVDAIGFSGTDANFRFVVQGLRQAGMREVFGGGEPAMPEIRLLKASEPYQTAINAQATIELAKQVKAEGRTPDASDKPSKHIVEFFEHMATGMVGDYYRNSHGIDTIWVASYFQVAAALHYAASDRRHGCDLATAAEVVLSA